MKKLIVILVFLLFASTASAKEIYILYETSTGYIVSSGRVDLEWDSNNRDGSTISGYIERKVAGGLAVLFLPNQKLPNRKKHKIVDATIVNLTEEDKGAIEAAKPKSRIELLEERLRTVEEALGI